MVAHYRIMGIWLIERHPNRNYHLRQIQARRPTKDLDIIHNFGHPFCTPFAVDGIRFDAFQIANREYRQASSCHDITNCKFERFAAILRATVSC